MGPAVALAAALGLHEGDCADLSAMRGRRCLCGATMTVGGVGLGLALGSVAVLAVCMLFALLLRRA